MHAPVAAHETVAKRHRPSGLTVFLSAFVAGAVVSFGINHFVDSQLAQNRPQVECEPIFVALRSLPQGAPVTVWDVALKDWPLAMLPTSALRADNSFEGMVLRYPLREGQPLLAVQLARAPTEPGAIATHVESFSSPTPAAARRTVAAENDAWLPAPNATSTVTPQQPRVAATPVAAPRPAAVEETAAADQHIAGVPPPAAVAEATPTDVAFDADAGGEVAADPVATTADLAAVAVEAEAAPALPLVAIADTPVEMTAPVDSALATEESQQVAAGPETGTEIGMDMLLASAAPSSGILSVVEEPLSGFTATDEPPVDRAANEPRPFVAARRSRPPMAPHPRLDIADPIAVLTRERSPSPSARPLEAATDAPAESVLVATPVEDRDAAMTGPEQPGPAPAATVVDAGTPPWEGTPAAETPPHPVLSEATPPDGTPLHEPLADGAPAEGLVNDVEIDRTGTPPPTAATSPEVGEPAMVLPIPRYLVIPERIAVEADSFFGTPTPAAEFPGESLARPEAGDQPTAAARKRAQYEQPPVANPPAPTFGEMFPNISNGIDALTGPFRGRSAAQPRRTR